MTQIPNPVQLGETNICVTTGYQFWDLIIFHLFDSNAPMLDVLSKFDILIKVSYSLIGEHGLQSQFY